MKKGTSIVLGIVILAVLVVGGFALFHKSPKATPGSSTAAKSSSASPVNNAVLTTKTNATLGQYLAAPNGKALYTYGADTSGVSNCTGECLANWPAYQPTATVANLPSGVSTIKRTDSGQTQYTYNGLPLYYFVSDSAGKVTGNGINNFSVATPKAAATSTAPATDNSAAQPADNPSSSNNPY